MHVAEKICVTKELLLEEIGKSIGTGDYQLIVPQKELNIIVAEVV